MLDMSVFSNYYIKSVQSKYSNGNFI